MCKPISHPMCSGLTHREKITKLSLMPSRLVPLVDGQIYHIFNRGVAQQPMFITKRDCERFLKTLWFYHFFRPPVRFSTFNNLSQELKSGIEKRLSLSKPNVSLCAFCLMPNHFHLLVRQEAGGNISSYLKNITDSYTKFFNTKYKRNGPIFQGQFKAVRAESDEQLIHLSRYIHLNPVTSYVVRDFDQLLSYPWSSLVQYLGKSSGFCETETVLGFFSSKEKYSEFLQNQIDYQRTLESIKHILFE